MPAMLIPDPIKVIWVDVPDVPIEVNNLGEVRATEPDVEVKFGCNNGYKTVYVRRNGELLKLPHNHVYRLIALLFYGPLPKGLVTRHKNDVKSDDRLGNLTYGTISENVRDSYRNGTGRVWGRKPKDSLVK